MKNDDELIFDDSEAVEYIWNLIPQEDRKGMSKDDIEYVLDAIYDYYESENLITDDDVAESASIDEQALYEFVKREAAEDGVKLTDVQIQLILDGEFEYGVSKGIYDEEEDENNEYEFSEPEDR